MLMTVISLLWFSHSFQFHGTSGMCLIIISQLIEDLIYMNIHLYEYFIEYSFYKIKLKLVWAT